jgi:hypothetical protein
MIWKGLERKRSWHDFVYCPRIFLEELRKTMKTLRITDIRA